MKCKSGATRKWKLPHITHITLWGTIVDWAINYYLFFLLSLPLSLLFVGRFARDYYRMFAFGTRPVRLRLFEKHWSLQRKFINLRVHFLYFDSTAFVTALVVQLWWRKPAAIDDSSSYFLIARFSNPFFFNVSFQSKYWSQAKKKHNSIYSFCQCWLACKRDFYFDCYWERNIFRR